MAIAHGDETHCALYNTHLSNCDLVSQEVHILFGALQALNAILEVLRKQFFGLNTQENVAKRA